METQARLIDRWRRALIGLVASCALVLAFSPLPTWAQDEDRPPEPKPPEPKPAETVFPPALKDGTLDLSARIYLPDNNSVPRLIPNVRLSEFIEWTIAQGRRAEGGDLPTFKFEQLQVQARIEGGAAQLRSQIKLTLSETAQKVTEVPLRLQSCLLTERVKFEGEGKSQIQVGRNDQPGYTWWLQAEPNTTHSAELVGQTVIQSEGDRQSFQLTLPVTLSTIEVTLPAEYQDVSVRGQGGELVTQRLEGAERKVVVQCQGGDLNVAWRTLGQAQANAGAMEVSSKTRWIIEDPAGVWEATSELSLRAFEESPVEKLVVDLPPGAQWLAPDIQPIEQYKLSSEQVPNEKPAAVPAAPDAPPQSSTSHTRLTIQATTRLGLSSLESMQIRWRWTPPIAPNSPAATTVPGLQVSGVDRHEGTSTLVVPSSLGLQWKSAQGVDLVQQSSIVTMQERVQYVFRFARQDQELQVSFKREVNLAEVKPTYLVRVGRDQVKMYGWIQCVFNPAQQPELVLDLGEWELDSAQVLADMSEPYADGELLRQESIGDSASKVVKLSSQLDPESVSTGHRVQQFWRVVANLTLEQAPGRSRELRLQVPMIRLMADDQSQLPLQHASGSLLVAGAENVLLSWDQPGSQSLLTDALSESLERLQPAGQAPRTLTYRFQADEASWPIWKGKVEILPRRIAAEQRVELNVEADEVRLVQKFDLQIANEPLSAMMIDTHGAREVNVLVNGIPWVLQPAGAPAEAAAPDQPVDPGQLAPSVSSNRQRAYGTESLIGTAQVEIRSQRPIKLLTDQTPASQGEELIDIPVPTLELDDVVVRNPMQLIPRVSDQFSAWIREDTFTIQSAGSTASQAGSATEEDRWLPLTASELRLAGGEDEIQLRVARQAGRSNLVVRVSGAWLQTALSGTTRADRFCARFQTDQDSLTIRLPAYDLAADVAIDGIRQSFEPNDGRLRLSLRDFARDQPHTLEIWTRSANTVGWLNRIAVRPVTIEGCPRLDQFYWQVVTASNQHLLTLPSSLTPEWRWVWDRFCWQRRSSMDQGDFEQWLGAPSQQPLPPAANKYVASSFGDIQPFHVWTASRLLLWLPVGLIAIGGSILVSLFRALRHPAALLLLVACLLGLAAVWPDLSVLVGQTSLVALSVVLLYAATQAAIESRVRRRSIFGTRPVSGYHEVSEAPSLVRPASHGSSEIVATTRTQTPIASNGGSS